ncbi:MAG: 4-alpha-glucanotransferase [Thermoleophilia bacterium]
MLLHVTSLPGGRLGPDAFAFVDWLAAAGQEWWQVLPLTPPDGLGSPYASPSAFAGRADVLSEPDAPVSVAERDAFRRGNAYWIEDWEAHAGPGAVDDQVRFAREWSALRAHAASRGVRILGDLPFYVAPGGADVAAHPALFRDDVVAGVPPDAFSDDGQLWGNPTYDWDAMAADGWRWWTARLGRSADLHDASRIDHFRAFESWWAVPRGAETAREGEWRPGPGDAVVRAARAELGDVALVAEDLGIITPAVHELMDGLGLPGMRVLQFAFPGGPENTHRPEHHPERSLVCVGTHDNDTAVGWWEAADEATRTDARDCAGAHGIHDERPERMLMRLALASRARLAVLTAQDLLGLGGHARLNTPGVAEGNWTWRLRPGELTPHLAAWLRERTKEAGRLP